MRQRLIINSSQLHHFTLAAYFDTGMFKYLCFIVILLLYVFIIFANVLLITVISMNRSLHEPMYLFLCSLFVNELYGSTGLFPSLLRNILSDIHTVSLPLCFLQIFIVYSYGGVEFLNLAIMSFDRYLSICHPLQYNTHMTYKRVAVLLAVTWLLPIIIQFLTLPLIIRLQFCGNIINKVYCDNYSMVKLSCFDTTINNVYGLIICGISMFVPLILILYTYIRILKVCFSGTSQTRQKAVSTCTPHLASLINFTFGACFEILQSRFNMKQVPDVLRIFLSLYFLICPPIFNPVMYGLKLSKIRVTFKSLMF